MLEVGFGRTNKSGPAISSARNFAVAKQCGLLFGLYNLGKYLKKTINTDILKKDKRGRVYNLRTKSGRRRKHRASAPGQTAANLSGTYRKSVDFRVEGANFLEFGASAPYAKFLELGTSKMAPRPGLQNAMRANYRNGRNRIERGIASKFSRAKFI